MDEIRGTDEIDFTSSQNLSVLFFIGAFFYEQFDNPFNNIHKKILNPDWLRALQLVPTVVQFCVITVQISVIILAGKRYSRQNYIYIYIYI